jgi:hypothetical protein
MKKFILILVLLFAGIVSATVSTEVSEAYYTGDGSDTTFDFSFPVFSVSDLSVYLIDTTTGDIDPQSYVTDYTVSATNNDYSSGGTITFGTAPSATEKVYIVRIPDLVQSWNLSSYSSFRNVSTLSMENTLDKIVMQNQYLYKLLSTAILAPIAEANSMGDFELPNKVDRASKYLAFDADGAVLTTSNAGDSTPHSTFGATLADDANATEALGTLGFSTFVKGLVDDANEVIFKNNLNLKVVNVADYATSGSGTSDSPWVGGLQAAYNANGKSASYYLPAGYYEDQTTVNFHPATDGQYIRIFGDGVGTIVRYDANDGTPCWDFNSVDSSVGYLLEIQDIYFTGQNTATGSCLRMYDVSNVSIKNVNINDWDSANTSTGIEINGREIVLIEKCYIAAKIGILIGENPNSASIDADTFTIRNCDIRPADADNGYGVKITGDMLFNINIDGLNVPRAKYCVYIDCTSADGTSGSAGDGDTIHISHSKFEQGDTINKDCWGVYIVGCTGTDVIKGFKLSDTMISGMSGIYVRDVTEIRIDNCIFAGSTGYTSVDANTPFQTMTITNSYIPSAATLTVDSSYDLAMFIGDKDNHRYGFATWTASGRIGYGTNAPESLANWQDSDGNSIMHIYTDKVNIDKYLYYDAQTITVADSNDPNAATLTLTPTNNIIAITNQDPNGCNVTFNDGGSQMEVLIINAGTNTLTFSRVGGTQELDKSGSVTLGKYDTIRFVRYGALGLWIQTSYQDNYN